MRIHVGKGEVTSPLRRDGLVILLFIALTCVMTNPLVLHLANAVEDKQDALLNTWIIAWVGHALITDPLNLFNANIFYPYLNTLAYSETLLPQGLFALPFNLAFDNTILGYNLVLLASFLLAAYAMYLFVFDLTRNRGAGIIAGTIFAFNPYNLGNLAQVQLLSFGWMPVTLLFLRRLLRTDRQRQAANHNFQLTLDDFRLAFLFALSFSFQALSSFYYAFLAGFAVVLYIIWFFIMHRAPRPTPDASRITFYAIRIAQLTISAVLIAIIIIPFFIPYLQVQREMGFERKVSESEPFSASLKLYSEVAPHNVLYGNMLAPKQLIFNGGYPLDNLFPGVLAVALAIVGVAISKERDKWFYFLLLVFAFLLSLGPRLFLAPNAGTDIALPYRWLYDIFPLMKALRAPVRFDALVMFALATLAGFGAHRLSSSVLRPPSFAIIAFIALEYLAFPAATITPVPVWNEIPEYVRWLRTQPPGVVLELPMIASDPTKPLDLTTQYLSTYHWHPTPDGYSGFNPKSRDEITDEIKSLPSERAVSLLQALDVQYLVSPCNTLNRAGDLALLKQFNQQCIYSIASRDQDSADLSASLYLPQPAAPNQNYFAYLVVQDRAARSFAFKPTETPQMQARWNDDTPQSVVASFPLVISKASVISIPLTTPTQTGNYKLSLRASSPAIGAWNLSGDVQVKNEEPAREVVLPVGVSTQTTFKTHYAAGEDVLVDLSWLAFGKIDAYYSASVRVIDTKNNKVANVDREPAGRTFLWRPGNTIPDRFALTLPPTLAPGDYTINVMMYQAEQNVDALLLDQNFAPQKSLIVGIFTVK